MCGICGFSGFRDDSLIGGMMDTMIHRGPDARDFYADDEVTLGHTRLSIIDLSERGRQPMTNETGDVWITYNGEIYNFPALKNELGNHRFISDCDTEVLVHAYEEYGLAFLEKLRGMFAFCLYDRQKNLLVLARDPIGKKPLYYSWDGRHLIFGSEIKAVLKAYERLGIPRTISRHALCSYLRNQYVAGPQTLVSGIRRLPPGTYLTLDLETRRSACTAYWGIREAVTDHSVDFYATTLRNLLRESVRLRLIADVPVGSFLSGGIDSTGITAIARESVPYDFHTFTAGFRDANPDMDCARDVAGALDCVHHEIVIDPRAVLEDFDRITWHFDEPLGDAAIIANYYLAKEARRYVRVVLAGEGSDELFGGYSSYRAGLKWHPWFRLPKPARAALDQAISLIPGSGDPARDRRFVYAHYLGQESLEMAQQYAWQITGINDDEQRWLGSSSCRGFRDTVTLPAGVKEPLNRLLLYDCTNHLPDLYLMKADKATMAHSVEERVPILDRELIAFAFTIPPKYKIFQGTEKYIWRRALADLVPPEILHRPKKGFSVPYTGWIAGELRESAIQALDEGPLCRKLFDPAQVQKLFATMSPGGSNRSPLVAWNLFALERWAAVFGLREIAEDPAPATTGFRGSG